LTSNGTFTPAIPEITGGHLVLTRDVNSQQGTIILDDLDAGALIEGFTATFKLQIGPGSYYPADGLAFCFAPGIDSTSNFGEDGTGTGVIVSFDIYDNGGGEAPAVDVIFGGNTIATTKYAKEDMATGVFEDVRIQVTANSHDFAASALRRGSPDLVLKSAALFPIPPDWPHGQPASAPRKTGRFAFTL